MNNEKIRRSSALPPLTARPPLPAFRLAAAIAAALAIAGCGTVAPRPGERSPTVGSAPAPAAPRGGGYYLDDGPGANPPANLESVPDATPRVEALHRGALRPYTIMGRDYTPMTAIVPYKARGIASWYGRRYHGKPTSSGEIYDMYGMTAAHPVLPIPSYARVTNVGNGKSVIVRINDRGPFLNERLIDLSYTAAYKLGVLHGGSGLVEVETIMPGAYATVAARTAPATASPAAPPLEATVTALAANAEPVTVTALPPGPATAAAEATAAGVFLQLGAFSSRDNAESYLSRVRARAEWLSDRLEVWLRDGYYRVHAGPYESPAVARSAADRLAEALGLQPLLVNR